MRYRIIPSTYKFGGNSYGYTIEQASGDGVFGTKWVYVGTVASSDIEALKKHLAQDTIYICTDKSIK